MIAVVFRISMWRDLDRLFIIATPVVVMLDIVRFYKQRNVAVCVRYLQLDCLLLLRFLRSSSTAALAVLRNSLEVIDRMVVFLYFIMVTLGWHQFKYVSIFFKQVI